MPAQNNWERNALTGSLLGGGVGALFGNAGWENPAGKAGGYLDKIPGELKGYFNPYLQEGKNALGKIPGLEQQYGQILSNPGAFVNKVGQNFHQSPGFQFQKKQAMNAANNAAAAGGMAGSPQHQQRAAGMVNNLANQDYNQYLQHALGMYRQALGGEQGLEENMAGLGEHAGSSLAEDIASALESRANLAYKGQQSKNENQGGLLSGAGSLIGAGLGAAAHFGFL